MYIDPPSDLKRWLNLGPEDVLRLRKAVYGLINAPLRWNQRLSRALRQAGFVPLQVDPYIWILPAASPVKGVAPVDVPTKLKAAVVDSSVSPVTDSSVSPAADSSVSHVPESRKVRWKRQRNVLGVLGVHVDDLVGGGNFTFQKAVQWLRTALEFGTWEQSRFRFRGRELNQEYNRKSIKISMSKFVQEMEPVAVPQTCERRFGRTAGNQCALSISGRCRSASVVAIARKSTPVVCHWSLAEQVHNSQRS